MKNKVVPSPDPTLFLTNFDQSSHQIRVSYKAIALVLSRSGHNSLVDTMYEIIHFFLSKTRSHSFRVQKFTYS
ncbi:hypothetical protein DsansV1_C22g0171541 [Dioscorea sansibarensis]